MRRSDTGLLPFETGILVIGVVLALSGILYSSLPSAWIRPLLLASGILLLLLTLLQAGIVHKRASDFANDICDTIDNLMDGQEAGNYAPYEDTALSKIQNKLLQYYDRIQEGKRSSEQDKKIIQELVSDISHQVKTPIANIRMFADILKKPELSDEKQAEFLGLMNTQINKLDFLLQSLIKMSRLETGTFILHMENNSLYETIARAVSGIFAKADKKNIPIDVDCPPDITVRHDAKWTAEALENILDNAVKYTPEGGSICISVSPWLFYTRIDIADTGIGIPAEHYHHVFQRFYRTQETASEEGVGLGLYLARSIITLQRGYISVKSEVGKGTVFSVFLLS